MAPNAPEAIIQARLLLTALARAPEVELTEEVLGAGLEDENNDEDEVSMNPLVGEGEEDESGFAPEDVELLKGGGTSAFISTRWPTPQGIGSPVG